MKNIKNENITINTQIYNLINNFINSVYIIHTKNCLNKYYIIMSFLNKEREIKQNTLL